MQSLAPELDEIEAAALFGTETQIEITPREIGGTALLQEIRRVLSGGRPTQHIRARSLDDIERINRNLRQFLDTAEDRCPPRAIDQAYASHKAPGSPDYRRVKSRFTTSRTNLAMAERFVLLKAACDALSANGHEVDNTQACLDLFKNTDARMLVSVLRDQEALLDAGWQLSDAWLLIAEALDRECNLTGWFTALSDETNRRRVPLAQFLGVDVALDLATMANCQFFSQSIENNLRAENIADRSFEPAQPAGFDRCNLSHHFHDLAAAPAVPLFRFRSWQADGRLRNLLTGEALRAGLSFWREYVLMLLPSSDGPITPYLVNRLRASLHRGSKTGDEIPLRYPYIRALDWAAAEGGDTPLPHAPLFLKGSVDAHRFEPANGWPEGDDVRRIGASIHSQFAQVWGARPDVIPLFLRWHTDFGERPLDPRIEKIARENQIQTFFPAGSLGAVIESATLTPDRSAGIGALLRADFQRKLALFRKAGGKDHLPPVPHAFAQAWS